jgi:transposase
MKYIGIDAHGGGCSICVLQGGSERPLMESSCRTDGRDLIEIVSALAAPRKVVLEESTIADWVYRVLHPHVEEIIVSNPRTNALIAKDQNITDAAAAHKLALLLRAGLISGVHHAAQEDQMEFKRLVLFYHKQGKDLARKKSQLKAIFRTYAIACPGAAIYTPKNRPEWLDKLPEKAQYRAVETLTAIDAIAAARARSKRRIASEGKQYEQIKRFRQVPGIGPIRAATFFAIIDTPSRFRTESKLWSYCGIGMARRQSSDYTSPGHLNWNGNPILKNVAKGAALTAIGYDNRFRKQYQHLLYLGKRPERAKLTIARAIISTMYGMWRKNQPYDDRHIAPATTRKAASSMS